MSKQDEPVRVRLNPPVFAGAAGLILIFVVFSAGWPDTANALFSTVQTWITDTFGWFYMLSVAAFVIFCLGLAASEYGRIKLGPDDSEPDYSYRSWFAMLFSAGMGIGLMFFGVAEPITHFANPPVGDGGTIDAAREAMKITFFHWGIHAWAIYAVIGLSLAYYSFRYGLPLTIRSALFPLIGDRIYGPIGHTADIFAVLGTMFGVATSTEALAAQARYIPYGPMRRSSMALLDADTVADLPTAPQNLAVSFRRDPAWWARHMPEIAPRFERWADRPVMVPRDWPAR